METIYKYPLGPETILKLPPGAQPLTVQLQDGESMLWVKLDPAAPTISRHFRCVGTGHIITDGDRLTYIATFQLDGVVFHAFEEGRHD